MDSTPPNFRPKKILLLNGPARCGKDTLAKILVEQHGFAHLKITAKWKQRVHALYGMADKPHDYFEQRKDQKAPEFYGLTPREAYIRVWEDYFKDAHGETILLDWLIDDIDKAETDRVVISDVGFDREARYLFDYYGRDAMLIKIYRAGYDFTGDTRRYVQRISTSVNTRHGKDFRYANLYNNKTPQDMIEELKFILYAGFGNDFGLS